MIEYENSKSDDQLEELLLLTEQMQEELDQKDRTIEELRVQLDESLTLNERLNSENRAGNIQALKNDRIGYSIANLCHILPCQYSQSCNVLYKSGDCIKEYNAIRNKYF